ncbi:Protein of unknown function [Cotesia congregata]|uniref:Uncharacterized protein n=1 Tax=Cotesia congregata TaxID=51543 RepID=A0A8J2EDN3_COTCN|nr:Protein of unknown function [Cotesia congregata]
MGVEDMEVTLKERAVRYLKDIMKMEEGRWPRIVMKEEMRGILNGKPTKWGKVVRMTLEKMECEEVIKMMIKRKN